MTYGYQIPYPIFNLPLGDRWLMRDSLFRTLGQYTRHAHHVKVGITNNPYRRWYEHSIDGWEKMVVVYRSPCRTDETRLQDVREIERELIEHVRRRSTSEFYYYNIRDGGDGPPATGDQYVYVLLSSKWRKRR